MRPELEINMSMFMTLVVRTLELEGKYYQIDLELAPLGGPLGNLAIYVLFSEQDSIVFYAPYQDTKDDIAVKSLPYQQFDLVLSLSNIKEMLLNSETAIIDHPSLAKLYRLLVEVDQLEEPVLTEKICDKILGIMEKYLEEVTLIEEKSRVHYLKPDNARVLQSS